MKTNLNQQKTFEQTKGNTYILLSIIISLVIVLGFTAINYFCPDFIFKSKLFSNGGKSRFLYMIDLMFGDNSTTLKRAAGIANWAFSLFVLVAGELIAWLGFSIFFQFIFGDKWHKKYINGQSSIITSCDPRTFTDRVAIVTPTCNDFSPRTLLQTASQTYPNCDVWICNDSNKPEVIKYIEDFAKEHNFHVLHRSAEHKKAHPSKVGNLFYFVQQYGDKYDFVLENDSSSIISSTFVENALCYFHSPLIDVNKTGAVICYGSFYGTKNAISLVNTYVSQWNDSFGGPVGSCVKSTGHPVLLDGWGTLYRTSTLKNVDLDRVECPSDDMARGLVVTKQGYLNYLDPFDFAGKFGPQNMEGWKVQRLKWNGGDIFCVRKGLAFQRLHNKYWNGYMWAQFFSVAIMIPLTFIAGLVSTTLMALINAFYVNFSVIILISFGAVAIAFVIVFLLVINECPIKLLFTFIFGATLEAAIIYKRAFTIVIDGYIRRRWSSSAVTVKTVTQSTTKQKIRMSIFDFVILVLGLALCFCLQFAVSPHLKEALNPFIIWFNILFFVCGPSFLYLVWVWIGEIKVKTGWDDKMDYYPLWEHDFRFNYVKDTEVWKTKHAENYTLRPTPNPEPQKTQI